MSGRGMVGRRGKVCLVVAGRVEGGIICRVVVVVSATCVDCVAQQCEGVVRSGHGFKKVSSIVIEGVVALVGVVERG